MESSSKSRDPRGCDRLSELPDSLIFNIFEFLPVTNVVGTDILSHRWKNLWTFTPYLCFDNKSADFDKFRNFVNRALLCWRGKKIQKFKLSSVEFDKSLSRDMDLWVRFAVDNGVEDLDISFSNVSNNGDDYSVPKCLFSCSSLKKLSLFGNITEINEKILQWNQLKSLDIVCYSITQHAVGVVLSRSPVLEVFRLSFQERGAKKLTFRSSSLKELWVRKRLLFPDDIFSRDHINTKLVIWTPNLEILKLYGGIYGECLVMDIPSKVHATLWFDSNIVLVDKLRLILPSIGHAQGLTLSDSCIKAIEAITIINRPPPLSRVIFLNLSGRFDRLLYTMRLLEHFPKLKTLVLEEEFEFMGPSRNKFLKPSESFLGELRTVKVTWSMRDFSIFPLIMILLKYGSKLEEMVFRVKRRVPSSSPSDSLFLASQKLLKMPRTSPTAKVTLCEY